MHIELPINSHYNFALIASTDSNVVEADNRIELVEEECEETNSQSAPQVPTAPQNKLSKFIAFFTSNFLPIGFLVATILALGYPTPGKVASSFKVSNVGIIQAVNSFNVFLISGVTLNISEARSALSRWHILLCGVFFILIFTPLFSLVVVRLPLSPSEYSVGLAIFCTVPTTLGVGVALTTACDGDQSLALLLTIITNCLGILTTPLAIQYFLSSSSIDFEYSDVLTKLCLTVLAPSLIGIALRITFPVVADFAKAHKVSLSMFSTSNLVCIIWQTLSAASDVLLRQSAASLAIVVVASSLQHLLFLAIMYVVTVCWTSLRPPEKVALIIMCAQKSAPVAVTLISYITSSSTEQGLLAVPALVGQLAQIFIGSFLLRYLKKMARIDRDNVN